ncbi:hypothetical protein ACFR9U_20140 [Halorientalis brevis]|uniref:DUF7344 domain-containing protein n=1 Tax=Halorientalis brevis TaxID=1126241 RepID=A0ABD6CJ23_9EURY|nr:hypothetical protein [Halorientalis brevis]
MSGTSHDEPRDDNSIARVLAGLSSKYRRLVIEFFMNTAEETISLTELAEYVRSEQSDDGAASLREIKIQLHHRTLPKLAANGVVDYDARSTTVRYRGDSTLEEIQEYLSTRDV